MKLWIVETGEPLPIDNNPRLMRAGVLANLGASQEHDVVWWATTFNHALKVQRFEETKTISVRDRLVLQLLFAPSYSRNITPARVLHNRKLAGAFAEKAYQMPPPDIIFCCLPTLEVAQQVVKYGKQVQVPVIIDIRDQWPDVYLTAFPQRLHKLARLLLTYEYRRLRFICRQAAGITAVSKTYLDWGLKFAGRPENNYLDEVFPLGYRSHTMDTPANLEPTESEIRAKYGLQADDFVLVFVGSFGSSYDLETVLLTAKVLQEKNANIKFVLAGDGDKGPKLRKLAAKLQNVVFTGWLDQKSIKTVLSMADAGLAPYVKGALQSLPNKPFEYMASGLPILSSLSGELASLIREEKIGLEYKARNIKSLTEEILKMFSDPFERGAMGRRALALFEKRFRVQVVYPQLVQYLERVAQKQRVMI